MPHSFPHSTLHHLETWATSKVVLHFQGEWPPRRSPKMVQVQLSGCFFSDDNFIEINASPLFNNHKSLDPFTNIIVLLLYIDCGEKNASCICPDMSLYHSQLICIYIHIYHIFSSNTKIQVLALASNWSHLSVNRKKFCQLRPVRPFVSTQKLPPK